MPAISLPRQSTFDQLVFMRRRWFGGLFTVLFLVQLIQIVLILAFSVVRRGDLTYPEGAVVGRTAAFAQGEPVYANWREWPHQFAPYGPLTYVPVGLASRIFNPTGGAWWVYVAGRLQSLVMMLGMGLLLFDMGRRIGLSRLASLAALGALAFWTALLSYGVSYRPDAPATFFAILALYVVIRSRPRPAAIVAALAALYVSYWFKPMAFGMVIVVALWIGREWGLARSLLAFLLFSIAGLLPLWLLDRYWNPFLFENLIGFNIRAGFALWFFEYYFASPRLTLLVMIVGSVFAIGHVIRRSNAVLTWLSVAALATLAITLVQCLKIGSDINYFMLPYPLLNLIAFHAVATAWKSDAGNHFVLRETLLWIFVIPLLAIGQIAVLSGIRTQLSTISQNLRPREFEQMLAAKPGLMLNWMAFHSLIGSRPPTLLDPFAYKIMVQYGEIDPEILRGKIRRQEFAFMVFSHETRTDKETVEFHQIISKELETAYEAASRFPAFVIYEPKKSGGYEH